VPAADDRDRETFYHNYRAFRPGFLELNAVDGGENIDTSGRDADLEDDPWLHKILGGKIGERGAEVGQGRHDPAGVLGSTPHPEVDVAGGPRQAVNSHRIGADNEELNLCCAELGQYVAEVGVQQWKLP
jgi:hypothetical protein